MPILSIISQPATKSLNAAYRPVTFLVKAQATNGTAKAPVVYCDVYTNGVYFKTLAKTQYDKLNSSDTDWRFDIQDIVQEVLKKYLSSYGGITVEEATTVSARIFCRFRSSGIDTNGFIQSEGFAPIQGTSSAAPVPGTGVQTNEFFVINATLDHEDNQNLATNLAQFKTGTWAASAYPLTRRPAGCLICYNDNDYFPFFDAEKSCYQTLHINYRFRDQSLWRTNSVSIPAQPCTAAIGVISQVQFGNTVTISWTYTGTPEGFLYRMDGGPWIITSNTSVDFTTLADGAHEFDVKAFCNCAETVQESLYFTKVAASATCSSAITALGGTQTGIGSISIPVTATGAPPSFRYRVDGGAWIDTASNPIAITSLTAGGHFIEVFPVCANGALGTGFSGNFTINSTAIYSVINFNAANGNHNIQRSFDDGKTNVNYRIFCSGTTTFQGPFNAAFTTGLLISGLISGTGPHCNTAMTDKVFTP